MPEKFGGNGLHLVEGKDGRRDRRIVAIVLDGQGVEINSSHGHRQPAGFGAQQIDRDQGRSPQGEAKV
jgi:hypothetical protein